MLIRDNRRADIVVMDEITNEGLLNFGLYDAYVSTACPRLPIDDPEIFPGPVLNPGELKYVLSGTLENYDPRDLFRLDLPPEA